jgi:AmmeMemoRadiSam system protein B
MNTARSEAVRAPAVAGMFYPADPDELRSDVDAMLSKAGPQKAGGELVALIVPHAGYVYSGLTAAHAYRLLKGRSFDTVVTVGPSHRDFFQGVNVYPGDAYRTPLGDVEIDRDFRDRLVKAGIALSSAGHRAEHSVEVQLPFLQRVLGSFRFVPLVMGNQTRETCGQLAAALAEAGKGKNFVLVASSDLSHFHPYADAVELDRQVADFIGRFDSAGLMECLEEETVEACGGGPVVAVMDAARRLGADRAALLHYCNSGDVTGDHGSVVGYLAAALMRGN